MTPKQRNLLKQNQILLSDNEVEKLIGTPPELTTLDQIVLIARICNLLYRAGIPLVSDLYYDQCIIPRLVQLDPQHPFLHQVEPETDITEVKTKPLPTLMLSTQKAYEHKEVINWLTLAAKAADAVSLDRLHVALRLTPKLDGYACYDDGETLYTRGDGVRGTDITHILRRGVRIEGERGLGPGELVVVKSYFDRYLADEYENSRNIQGSVIREQQLSSAIQKACQDGAIVFQPFALLPRWEGSIPQLLYGMQDIIGRVWRSVDYDVDGVVFEVTNEVIKTYLGHTSHHHRWQLAFKRNEAPVKAVVMSITPQTGKSGRVTPVVEIAPLSVSGATISRATAHNYGHIVRWKLGPGSEIQLVRAGLVIPKIVDVIKSTEASIPSVCPSCQTPLVWEKDFLLCPNSAGCPAQLSRRLEHFFTTIDNLDGFGPRTIEQLCQHGIRSLTDIYQLSVDALQQMGFGERQSINLVEALKNSQQIPIEDWKFLAAFNIPFVGRGGCKLIMQQYPLSQIFDLTKEQLLSIPGIGEKSADTILNSLKSIRQEFETLSTLGFTIIPTLSEQPRLPQRLQGMTLVFTGTMSSGSREALERQAESLGAKVGSSVTSKTTYLIVGDKPGQSKLKEAEEKQIKILTEAEYLALL